MAYDGINWTAMSVPLSAGLQQRSDDRARPLPYLDICRDVQFDEIGGLQTRYPFGPSAGAIFGGGTIANARRIERFGSEQVLFTDTQVYSRNAQLGQWILRGTHLAVAVTENPAFATTGDQIDGDRAELNGTVVTVWTEGGAVFVAAADKTTGSVLLSQTSLGFATARPRVVATATKIMLFYVFGAGLFTIAIDPANPAAAIFGASTTVSAANISGPYDVVRVDGQDIVAGAFQRAVTTNHTVFTVTAALAVATSTKARTADGPLAVASLPGGASLQVVRGNGTNVQGDFLTRSTLADVTVNQAIGTAAGTPINQIAACYRSVTTSGAFRCYVFWSAKEASGFGALFATKFNFVDSAGAIGAQAAFVNGLAPGSRAFDYNGSVYLWMTFGLSSVFQGPVALPAIAQAQNAYVLYRDDGFITAKAAYNVGAGLRSTTGLLPGVALTAGSTTYSWIGTVRRIANLGFGGSTGYAARTSRDIAFTFDSNQARRCAQLGNTLYVAGGEILQYDGARLTEVGFHFYPWSYDILPSGGPGSGGVADGTYGYKVTWRWTNARGDSERSSTATIGTATMTGGPATFIMGTLSPLAATHKTMVAGGISAEVWRTLKNQNQDTPFYLATSNDPNNATNPNKFVANDPTATSLPASGIAFQDSRSDAVISELEENPENGAVLENLAPPAAQIIFATDARLFLLAVAGDPDRGWYSKLRGAGEVAAFHDTLTFDVPRAGGDITAGWFDENGTLFVARATAIYAFAGPGLDNLGQGQNYTLQRTVSDDVGVSTFESVARTPRGTIFKSAKGWQMLHPGGAVEYIGDKVSDFDGEAVLAVHVVETQHHVRVLTSARVLLWDYLVNQWGEWTVNDGVHACMFGGAYVYLTATGTRTQLATYTGLTYGMDIETTWIKVANLFADAQNLTAPGGQGAGRVRRLQPLGEYRSSHVLRMRIAYDYNPTYIDDKAWVPTPVMVGGPLQVSLDPKRPQCEAIKLRITAAAFSAMADLATVDMTPAVLTSAGAWNASWLALAIGDAGNLVTMSVAFEDGTPFVIDVRDHLAWDHALQAWVPDLNNIGIKVTCRAGSSPTVGQLDTAIAAGSALLEVDTPDSLPTKVINAAAMAGLTALGTFTGGAFGSPSGEALKLTSLGLEVGVDPGLYRRLPAAQKV